MIVFVGVVWCSYEQRAPCLFSHTIADLYQFLTTWRWTTFFCFFSKAAFGPGIFAGNVLQFLVDFKMSLHATGYRQCTDSGSEVFPKTIKSPYKPFHVVSQYQEVRSPQEHMISQRALPFTAATLCSKDSPTILSSSLLLVRSMRASCSLSFSSR